MADGVVTPADTRTVQNTIARLTVAIFAHVRIARRLRNRADEMQTIGLHREASELRSLSADVENTRRQLEDTCNELSNSLLSPS